MEIVAAIGRIVFGLYFLLSGINHFAQLQGMTEYAQHYGLPAPKFMVIVSGLMLLLGGLAFVTGYAVLVGAWLLAVFLVVAAFVFHAFWKLSDPMERANQQAHFGKNLALAGAALALTLVGSWPLAVR